METGIEEGERTAERDLGKIENEVEHLVKELEQHATTIHGLEGDRDWIRERVEALTRDLEAIPKLPEETLATMRESLAHLAERIETLEREVMEPEEEEETKPPEPHHEEENRDDREARDRDERHKRRENQSILDRLF